MRPLRFALLAALVAALFVLVPAASADCLPGDPECELVPPESEQVNPDPGSGVGPVGEVGNPGSALPVQAVIPMPLPAVAEAILPEIPSGAAPSFSGLEIPLRYQRPGDVSCGVQALGMALDGLGDAAPTSSALLGFLQDHGMMYDFGTGVEELAYAAQSLGYGGSYAFHGATLDDLAGQLANGSPVVVSLGANGEGEPGHFVTVTGISPDGQWVSYNDPTLGEQAIPAGEFTRLWGLQGNSGVAVLKEVPPGVPDYSGYVALMAGLMALVSATPLGAKRYGVGGRVDSGGGGSSKAVKSTPKTVAKATSAPAAKSSSSSSKSSSSVKSSSSTTKSAAKSASVVKSSSSTTKSAAKSASVIKSSSSTAKSASAATSAPKARFDEEPPPAPKVMGASSPAPGIFDRIAGAVSSAVTSVSNTVRNAVSTVSAAVSRAASTASTAVRTTASTVTSAVRSATSRASSAVTAFVDDARTTIGNGMNRLTTAVSNTPSMVAATVRNVASTVSTAVRSTASQAASSVGSAVRRTASTVSSAISNAVSSVTDTVRNTATGTPTPPGSPTGTPTPPGTPAPTQTPSRAPYPPGFVPLEDEWPEIDIEGRWIARSGRVVRSVGSALTARSVMFNALESGRLSVSAPSLAEGTRRAFLDGYGYRGTTYNPSTVANITGSQLVRGTFSRGSLGTALITSVAGNIYDYGWGDRRDVGIRSQEFAVSTGVDFGMAVGTGLAAAGLVAVAVAGAAALGATAPVWLAIGATVAVGLGIGWVMDQFGAGQQLKREVNEGIDAWEGIYDNVGVIADALPGYMEATLFPAGDETENAGG